MLKSLYSYFYAIVYAVFKRFCIYILPVKNNKIILFNFSGKGFGDSPGYIAKEILRRNQGCLLIWVVKDLTTPMPKGIKKTKWNSISFLYHYASSKVIINNCKNYLPFKKKEQYYIQTWHGGFPFKFIEKECENTLTPEYVKMAKRDSSMTDLLLSTDKVLSDVMRKSFWYEGEIFESGLPRNDIYIRSTTENIIEIKRKLQIPIGPKVLVYAPTFRQNERVDVYKLDVKNVLDKLEAKTNQQWIGIIRLHPSISDRSDIFEYSEKIVNGSGYVDSQEVFLISDFCITDYSSVITDFFMMNKPVVIFASDYKDYIKERELRSIYYEVPCVFCQSNEEVIEAIENFDDSKYQLKLSEYKQKFFVSFDDGHASERVVDRIFKVIGKS